uniref:Golgi SNAP receptor complex member 1 n=1 Tax=Cyprinus carpio TaxID=7962 RepID=A0A8C2Q509_CYPCA
MAGGNSNYWEDLRKQARQLENELDLKLVSFSKLCTSYSSSRDGRRGDSSSDTTPLLSNSTQDRMFETMSVEIEQLLAKLTGVNDKMAEYTSTPGVTSLNAALMHTLQRHRDILQDYTHEFHKTKSNFMAIREREDLLGSVRKDIETYKSGSGVNNRRTELFLKEHEHLRNSDRLIDDTISCVWPTSLEHYINAASAFLSEIKPSERDICCLWETFSCVCSPDSCCALDAMIGALFDHFQCCDRPVPINLLFCFIHLFLFILFFPHSIAMATKENMTSQRGLLKSIQSRVNTLANRFPAINNLIQRINLRKRRDSLILGGVIGICTILLLLYAFH